MACKLWPVGDVQGDGRWVEAKTATDIQRCARRWRFNNHSKHHICKNTHPAAAPISIVAVLPQIAYMSRHAYFCFYFRQHRRRCIRSISCHDQHEVPSSPALLTRRMACPQRTAQKGTSHYLMLQNSIYPLRPCWLTRPT